MLVAQLVCSACACLLLIRTVTDFDVSTELQDVLEYIEGMREHDVPYHVRFAIDTGKGSGGVMPSTQTWCAAHGNAALAG